MEKNRKELKKTRFLKASQAVSRRILVVEDNKNTQKLISDCLELMGFEVASADNGIEALNLFFKSCFDMVITDLQMPFMDGFNLASQIKKKSPLTPVILLTGAGREEVLMKVNEGLFYSVMFKPFKPADLKKEIHEVLDII